MNKKYSNIVNFSGTLGEGPSEQNLTKEKKHAFWKELCSPSAKTKKTQKSIKQNSKVWPRAETKNKAQAKMKDPWKFPPGAKTKITKSRNKKNVASHVSTPGKTLNENNTVLTPWCVFRVNYNLQLWHRFIN